MTKQLVIALILLPFFVSAQTWNGQWKATLNGLDIYLTIEEADGVYLTIPAQGLFDDKASYYEIEGDRLDFHFQKYGATFYGNLSNEKINGTWAQSGQEKTLTFKPSEEDLAYDRPQEPKGPFAYKSEDVEIKQEKDDITLAGTLTYPDGEGPFPAVVLISGSGPQNRNSEIFGHKSFLLIADYLTNRGYAVMRYDDRGVGESTGKFAQATSEDLSYDAEAVFEYLRTRDNIRKDQVGYIGHSEGGMIAPMVAARNQNVAFLVLLAGPGTPIDELMIYQLKHTKGQFGLSKKGEEAYEEMVTKIINLLKQDKPNDQIVDELEGTTNMFYRNLSEDDQEKMGPSEKAFYFKFAPGLLNVWMRYFLKYDPSEYLSKVTVPVLAMNGKKDRQVLAKPNTKAIKKALKSGGNKNVKIKRFRKLNHLFQTSKTGEGSEYAIISETFNPKALEYMHKWLDKQVGE